jgi:glycosyltransferase involved in cell wall biosynthesis
MTPELSIILPYYRKIEELRLVLPLNLPHLQRADHEVILVLDEPSEEQAVLELLAQAPGVRWRVIVNDRPHAWRSPSVSINVGLRHALGTFILVVSPESIFVDDVSAYAIDILKAFPGCVALGNVAFVDYEPSAGLSLPEQIVEVVENQKTQRTLYGSIAARRADFLAFGGYDETISEWGGDDDNIRIRLEMAGCRLLACPELGLVHLTLGRRTPRQREAGEGNDRMRAILSPQTAVANPNVDWGREFGRIALDWRDEEIEVPATGGDTPSRFSVHRTIPVPSLRVCRRCGRPLYFQQRSADCICNSEGLQPGLDRFSVLPPFGHPRRIACVMQLHNECAYLPGCLRHLEGHVDAVVALNDGSTDDTKRILQQHPLVADILENPPSENHVWDERENKRRLLERARELGFEWVLACDADERYERQFLNNLRRIAAAFPPGHLSSIVVRVRELWDSPTRYRVDGIWGEKAVARFFALPGRISFAEDKPLHGRWPPDEMRRLGLPHRLNYNLYHCGTMHREDRIRRRDFYLAADPEQRFSSAGYEYLAEEGPMLRTEEIAPARSYDLTTLP